MRSAVRFLVIRRRSKNDWEARASLPGLFKWLLSSCRARDKRRCLDIETAVGFDRKVLAHDSRRAVL